INRLWDTGRRAYPDSIHADGSVSDSVSQHTSFLALLYDIIPEAHAAAALDNVLTPPEDMVRVGSPFAIMYYYEALEKAGELDVIIDSIYEAYLPMIEAGATTVWEVFPTSGARPGGFPTRSHVHAWSSAPVYFLNRIALGVRPTAPGGAAFEISPRLQDLTWAEGTVATARGPLHVAWRADMKTLRVEVTAPQGVRVRFSGNDTHEGRQVIFEVNPA
ncbi:MAG: alpha-L-rhamnosidase C-terminal domain-containing protein, partial [Anaerolineae bacterium]